MTSSGGSSPQSSNVAPRKRFVLSGPSPRVDPARDMVRDDLADVELADRVFAPHYARAIRRIVTRDVELRDRAKADAGAIGPIAAGSAIDLFDVSGGWAWVRSDQGPGYLPADAIGVP